MERDNREGTEVCAQCGAPVDTDAERGFEFGICNLLCWTCSIERGGQYDAELDSWTVSPKVGDLPDEAYGTAPRELRPKGS